MTPVSFRSPENALSAPSKVPSALVPRAASRLLRALIRFCDLVLRGIFRLPSRATQPIARRVARSVGDSCAGLLARISNKGLLPVQKLVGPDWTIIFVGSDASKREVRHLLFDDVSQEQTLEDVSMWTLRRRLPQWLAGSADLVVCETAHTSPRRLNAPVAFTVPSWVDQTITLPVSASDLLPTGRTRSYIERCMSEGYVFKITDSEDQFDRFYRDIYIPYTTNCLGERATLTPYEELKLVFRQGELILITVNKVPVAGRICYTNNDTLFAADAGVSPDGPDYWQHGGIATLDWYTILWAYDLGAKNVNFGETRGWQSDDVYEYKRLWGAKPARRSRIHTDWVFLAAKLSGPLQCRLNAVGFISEIKDRLYGVYISETSSTLARTRLNSRLSAMKRGGLEGLLLVSTSEQTVMHVAPPREAEKQFGDAELGVRELDQA